MSVMRYDKLMIATNLLKEDPAAQKKGLSSNLKWGD